MIVTCTVCGIEFDHADAASILDDEEEDRYYFCSAHCREQFDEEPGLFVGEPADDRRARADS